MELEPTLLFGRWSRLPLWTRKSFAAWLQCKSRHPGECLAWGSLWRLPASQEELLTSFRPRFISQQTPVLNLGRIDSLHSWTSLCLWKSTILIWGGVVETCWCKRQESLLHLFGMEREGARGFRSHGKQIMKNHGSSKVEVSSAAFESNRFFLPTFRKSKAWKCKRMEKSSQTSDRKITDQPVLVPSYPYEGLNQNLFRKYCQKLCM